MAILDHFEAARYKARKENFEKFMALAESQDKNGKINEWFQAHEYIVEMERKIEEQKKQLQEYQSCFNLIGKFIPRHSSIHDIIG